MRDIYVIGDIHGDFRLLEARFSDVINSKNIVKNDVLFVAGDAGFINSYESEDSKSKRIAQLNKLPFIIIVVLGNHENYDVIESLPEVTIFNGKCYKEDGVDVFYAKNGQIFDIDNVKFFTFNGGLSIDKEKRLEYEKQYGIKFWWPQEIKEEDFKDAYNNYFTHHVDYIITHDVPLNVFNQLLPFIPGRFKDQVCPLQFFLQKIYSILKFNHWYAGHYHPSYPITLNKITILPIGCVLKITSTK
ncbi:MAG: metallophosphatase family protein [Erysipelotrichaceae bacterium]|nr:metallophosphatase family protein [Erysipelotrichaceae bacterium]